VRLGARVGAEVRLGARVGAEVRLGVEVLLGAKVEVRLEE
jgi:hypothetical protein